jgi:hypothetical protein
MMMKTLVYFSLGQPTSAKITLPKMEFFKGMKDVDRTLWGRFEISAIFSIARRLERLPPTW